jgi:hypothetical protein
MEPPAVLRGRQGPRREGQGPVAITPPTPEQVARQHGPGAVQGGRSEAGDDVPGYLERRRPGRLASGDLRAHCASRCTTGAGRACRSPAHGQAASRARSPRSPCSSSRCRTSRSSRRARSACSPTS